MRKARINNITIHTKLTALLALAMLNSRRAINPTWYHILFLLQPDPWSSEMIRSDGSPLHQSTLRFVELRVSGGEWWVYLHLLFAYTPESSLY